MWSAAGSEESSTEDDDDDGKNKSLWEKVKNFCYNHRTEIAIGVLVIISIILYGQYKKPPTPPGPKPENEKDPTGSMDGKPQDVNPPPQQEDKKDEKTEEHNEDNNPRPSGATPPPTDDQTQETENPFNPNSLYDDTITRIIPVFKRIRTEFLPNRSNLVVPFSDTLFYFGATGLNIEHDLPLILNRIIYRISW
jgi:hypothetical protein